MPDGSFLAGKEAEMTVLLTAFDRVMNLVTFGFWSKKQGDKKYLYKAIRAK